MTGSLFAFRAECKTLLIIALYSRYKSDRCESFAPFTVKIALVDIAYLLTICPLFVTHPS